MQSYKNEDNFYTEKTDEDIFTTLLKKETSLNNIFPNAVYLKNSFRWSHWSYYIYFYNKINNTCYINDLNFYWSLERLSVTNTIEQLSSKILPHIQMVQSRVINQEFEIPKFIYFHNRWHGSKEIVRQIVELKPLYDENNNLYWFAQPNWKQWSVILKSDNRVVDNASQRLNRDDRLNEDKWSDEFQDANNGMSLM